MLLRELLSFYRSKRNFDFAPTQLPRMLPLFLLPLALLWRHFPAD